MTFRYSGLTTAEYLKYKEYCNEKGKEPLSPEVAEIYAHRLIHAYLSGESTTTDYQNNVICKKNNTPIENIQKRDQYTPVEDLKAETDPRTVRIIQNYLKDLNNR